MFIGELCDLFKELPFIFFMSLSIGIVGLPNVGKSTLFQAITKKQVDASNYPFCTIDPNLGTVEVPDERVDILASLTKSKKKIYSIVKFWDIAGLVEGAHKGEGLGNKFLSHIRETDVIVYVLRCFLNEKIINTQKEINVLKDKEILDTEMALKDLSTLEKKIEGLEKEVKLRKKGAEKERDIFLKAKDFLERGKILSEQSWEQEELKIINSLQLLTSKKRIYLLNGSEAEVSDALRSEFRKNNWPFLVIDILTEFEALEFSQEEKKELGLKLDILIKESYNLLGLITFFTTGLDETRAWDLKKGSLAPQAGGVIHSDFEDNFIRAEVICWKDLVESNGFVKAREKGLIRTEGKDYLIKDGDVIEIKAGV